MRASAGAHSIRTFPVKMAFSAPRRSCSYSREMPSIL